MEHWDHETCRGFAALGASGPILLSAVLLATGLLCGLGFGLI